MNSTETLRIKGLDDFSENDLNKFWEEKRKDITKILAVGISTKSICNLKCIYCYGDQSKTNGKSLSLEEQKSIISQAHALGSKVLIICGDWEPTMDRDLLPIIEYSHSYNMTTILFNNGIIMGNDSLAMKVHSMKGQDIADFFYNHDCTLMVKLDSYNQHTYERIVDIKGSYTTYRKALENIFKAGYEKVIHTNQGLVTRLAFANVVLKDNFKELPFLKKFAKEHNAQFICKLPAIVNRAEEYQDMMFPVEDYNELRKNYINNYSYKKETLNIDGLRCLAWYYGIIFDNEGESRMCYTLPYRKGESLGNIRSKSLSEMLREKTNVFEFDKKWPCPAKNIVNFSKRQMASIQTQIKGMKEGLL